MVCEIVLRLELMLNDGFCAVNAQKNSIMSEEWTVKEQGRNKAKWGAFTAAAVASALVIALASGCAGGAGQSSAQSSQAGASEAVSSVATASEQASTAAVSMEASNASIAAVEPAEPQVLEIGTASKESATMTIGNETGGKITDIAFSEAGSDGELEYLMEEGQTWKKGEQALVHFENLGKGVNYDIHFKVKKSEYTLHDLKLNGVDSLDIRMEDGIAYATFERSGSAISTLADETERAEAEAAAEEAPVNEDAYYEEEVYYDDSNYEEPAQQEDGCIDGGVQLR